MMKNKIIISVVSVGTIIAIGLSVARHKYIQRFTKSVLHLFAISKNVSKQTFSYAQLEGLPEPVQRYFRTVLPEGYPYISSVRLQHKGLFKTGVDKDWTAIEGEQYFTVEPPGFIWRGETALFSARDMFVAGRGRLVVTLASLVDVVDAQGSDADQGELLRWLGESVWFPTNLLPSERLEWSPIDQENAKLTFNYHGLSLYYIVSFNERGEITRMETQRYMTADRMETWVGELTDYQLINEVRIPTRIKATWKLPEGDHTYVDFQLQDIQYNVSEPY